MHRFFHLVIICKSITSQSVLEESKHGNWKAPGLGWVLENFPIQLLKGVGGVGCRMRTHIVI
jgi:hypothetical protein